MTAFLLLVTCRLVRTELHFIRQSMIEGATAQAAPQAALLMAGTRPHCWR
jgi:hypothetical protein